MTFELASKKADMSLRPIRATVAVATYGTICRAALHLHRSAPATTRAVMEVEAQLGVSLFDRSRQGLLVTDEGKLAVRRFRRVVEQLELAELEVGGGSLLADKITNRHLQMIIAVFEEASETAAARRLQLSQPAVTRTLRDLENIVGSSLFYRTTRGMIATSLGELLYRRAKLSLAEIRALSEDLANRIGPVKGRVAVGVLPLCATLLVPLAITRLLRSYPDLSVRVIEGRYDVLRTALVRGDIDILVGALRPPAAELRQEMLFLDKLLVVCRPGHPLLGSPELPLDKLVNAKWVVPAESTPARERFDKIFADGGLGFPQHTVESNSLASVRALLLESDRLSVASPHQVHYELRNGLLAAMAVDLGNTARHIGYAVLSNSQLTNAVNHMVEHLRMVCTELTA